MDFSTCPLYGITRKRDLNELLKIKVHNKNKYNKKYKPYIEKNPKPRLIEAPYNELKIVQRKIKKYLDCITYPNNVFSGIKGRSYINNAYYHSDSNYFLKMDMSKFFPNISIYNFYSAKLNLPNDIATILTDLSTIDLTGMLTSDIENFISIKGIRYTNHLPSGSPISSILSYLANIDMFDQINKTAQNYGCIVSFYVDDIIFSSKNRIPIALTNRVKKIINKYNQVVNEDKTKMYMTNDYKKITGCVIKNHELIIPNKTRYKIAKLLKQDNHTEKEINSILGLINNAHMFDRTKYNDLQFKIKNHLI